MTEASAVSARAEATAADHFRRAGELEARVDAHHERLGALEERQRTIEAHNQQMRVHISSIARLCESNAQAISKIEDAREKDNADLRAQLIAALREAPRSNRAGATLGQVLAALALIVVVVLVMAGRLG